MANDNIIQPEEFVKTKHHCYVVKEYANGGSIAQLLQYRSQKNDGSKSPTSGQRNKRFSEMETRRVMIDLLSALDAIYAAGLAFWDLSPETLLL